MTRRMWQNNFKCNFCVGVPELEQTYEEDYISLHSSFKILLPGTEDLPISSAISNDRFCAVRPGSISEWERMGSQVF